MYRYYILVLLFFLLRSTASEAQSVQLPPGFVALEIANGLDPVAMAIAPDGRLFIAEKNGQILIVRDGVLLPDPFVQIEVDNFNERGLQSIVLHPDFESNNFVYCFYMAPGDNYNKVVRLTANGDFAIPGSEEVLYEMDVVYGPNHNGGGMQFGTDGHLYIATGDGVDGGAPQSMVNTGGKIIRLMDNGTIPADNPFYNTSEGKYKAIWSRGLRNPFTLSVQPETGRLFFCDVGQSLWEEVNEVEKGKNYGWPHVEGEYQSGFQPQNYKDPIMAYGHDPDCAIVGGTFYNPVNRQFPPEYDGQFLFSDYCEGYIKAMDPNTGEVHTTLATGIDRPVAMLVDADGALYYLARAGMGGGSAQDNTSSDNGRLMKIIYTGSGAPFISRQPEDVIIAKSESAQFSVTTFGATPITFQWQKDGVNIPDANEPNYTFVDADLSDDGATFSCTITNAFGEIISSEAQLTVIDGSRPDPEITFPAEGTTYEAGTTISFAGMASDLDDGALDVNTFRWRVDFHHLDHTHPAMSALGGVTEGTFEIPSVGEISEEVFYRIYLTVMDSDGLSQTTYRDVLPEKTSFQLKTEPAGLTLIVDGKEENTPAEVSSVKGIQRALYAPFSTVRNDSIFLFDRWENNGEDQLISFFAGEENDFKAVYTGRPINGGVGLNGAYYKFLDGVPSFDQEPVFTKLDKQINFNWILSSRNHWELGRDSFCVRWTGSIVPQYDEEYTFYLDADDGVRLWIGEQLVIDEWEIRSFAEEVSGKIQLQAGQFYPFRLEYFEDRSNSKVILSWQSQSTPKQVVSQDQFFTKLYPNVSTFTASIYPNPTSDILQLLLISEETFATTFEIFDTAGRTLDSKEWKVSQKVTELEFNVIDLAPGLYFFRIKDGSKHGTILPFKKE